MFDCQGHFTDLDGTKVVLILAPQSPLGRMAEMACARAKITNSTNTTNVSVEPQNAASPRTEPAVQKFGVIPTSTPSGRRDTAATPITTDPVSLILAAIVIIFIYFLPATVAANRKHHNTAAITLLNLFLGWTFLGWLAALIWASTHVIRETPARQ